MSASNESVMASPDANSMVSLDAGAATATLPTPSSRAPASTRLVQ